MSDVLFLLIMTFAREIPADNFVVKAEPSLVVVDRVARIHVRGEFEVPTGSAIAGIDLEIGTLDAKGRFESLTQPVNPTVGLEKFSLGKYDHLFEEKLPPGKYAVRATAVGFRPGNHLGIVFPWRFTARPYPTVEIK